MADDVLRRILADKRAEVRSRQSRESISQIQKRAAAASSPRDFSAALHNAKAAANDKFPVIAEIKYKSPSRGVLRADFNPSLLAKKYADGGAACLSVLTDAPYFGGEESHLHSARTACDLPVLRKDFILEEWQIYESRAMGADAVLLIAAALSASQMRKFAQIAADLGMASLAEAHNESELQSCLQTPEESWIGINNRNLGDFRVSLQTSADLIPQAAGRKTVAESGVASAADVALLSAAGADAFLIGETLMRADNPAATLRSLFGSVN